LYVGGGAFAGSQVQGKMWTALPSWQ